MTKAELARRAAARAGITQVRALRVVNALMETLSELMASGGSVTLPGLGTFKTSLHRRRPGRNPVSGEPTVIEERRRPRFAPGRELRGLVANSRRDG